MRNGYTYWYQLAVARGADDVEADRYARNQLAQDTEPGPGGVSFPARAPRIVAAVDTVVSADAITVVVADGSTDSCGGHVVWTVRL